jgi:hypothetical protein
VRWRALRGPERLSLVLSAVIAVGFPVGAAVEGWFGVGPLVVGVLFAGLTGLAVDELDAGELGVAVV